MHATDEMETITNKLENTKYHGKIQAEHHHCTQGIG
jgi:hypothetical protein